MPGLLDGAPNATAGTVLVPQRHTGSTAVSSGSATEAGRLSVVEHLIERLEDERRQLGSEVAALRLIVEELREALLGLDERAESGYLPARTRVIDGHPHLAAAEAPQLAAAEPPPTKHTLPAGSVGIEVQLLSVESPEVLAGLQLALSGAPEFDGVRITDFSNGTATLRCYLRLPQPESGLIEIIQRALPSAKPLTGPGPGRLLLRMRPV
jgi:hypothetical protein